MEQIADSLLFSALVNELRLPLLQMSRLYELATPDAYASANLINNQLLRLVDAYNQTITSSTLALEPINLRALLQEAAQIVTPYALVQDFAIEVDERVSATPIIAHRQTLLTLLTLIATTLVSNSNDETMAQKRLLLASHTLPGGMVIGAFSNQASLTSQTMVLARELHGHAQQSVPEFSQTSTASLAIADRLSQQMSAPLKTYRHGNLTGIGSLFALSRQLHFMM